LWASDGTAAGTYQVREINAGSANAAPTDLATYNGLLYFAADNGTGGSELWQSDGTTGGTLLLKEIYAGSFGSSPKMFKNVNNTLFFFATDATNGTELWKTDGTAAGTVLVKNINTGANSSGPSPIVALNGSALFAATSATGTELWKSDGSDVSTVQIKDIYASGSTGSYPSYLTEVNGTLFFTANDGVNGVDLWKSDGTAAGTVQVKDVPGGSLPSNPIPLAVMDGILYYSYTDGFGAELWRSDGTAAGTYQVKDINPGAGSSLPSSLTPLNGQLYFSASDGTSGYELWRSDGTAAGTVRVADINPGATGSSPQYLTVMNGLLFFSATDPLLGKELFVLDITPPSSAITSPAPGAFLRGASLPVTGTALDGFSGITAVEVSADGVVWTPAVDTSGTGSWATWSASLTMPADGSWQLVSRAVDGAGNAGTGLAVPVVVDTTPPETAPSVPAGTYAGPFSVTLGCSDGSGSGCSVVYYCLGSGCTPTDPTSGSIPVSGTTDLRFYAVDGAGNSETVRTVGYVFLAPDYAVNLTVSGNGSGNVTSTPEGIAANTGTTARFSGGATVTLLAAPDAYALFSGWSGDCGGTADCVLAMTADRNVTATFVKDVGHAVFNPGSSLYAASIQSAYAAAAVSDTILLWGTDFYEDLVFAADKAITLRGGYNGAYTMQDGMTTLHGNLSIAAGVVTVDTLVIGN
jgi:ELWxxDGT repeat protein